MSIYKQGFYRDRHARTLHAAHVILGKVIDRLPPIDSAVDLGCGVGTWLSVLAERGVTTVQGFDGPWVDRAMLQIPDCSFREANLAEPLGEDRRFDLAMSLEVAEHLPHDQAAHFVGSLTRLSDFVLFSAAIPNQGGTGHVNEQWPEYWAARFAEHGYEVLDVLRRELWDDEAIPYWYRQNVMLYVKQGRVLEVKGSHEASGPLSMVHPEQFSERCEEMSSVGGVAKLLVHAVKEKARS